MAKKACKNCRWADSTGKPKDYGYERDGNCDDCSLDPRPNKLTVNWEARFIKCKNCGFWTAKDGEPYCPEFDEEKGMNDTCPEYDIRYQRKEKE